MTENKPQLVRRRLAEFEDNYGPAAALAATVAGRDTNLPGDLYHGTITTVEEAEKVGAYMARFGNYPATMTPCEVSGINGNGPDGCPFVGESFCECGD